MWTAAHASVCHMRPVSGVQDIGSPGKLNMLNTPSILLEKVFKKNHLAEKSPFEYLQREYSI